MSARGKKSPKSDLATFSTGGRRLPGFRYGLREDDPVERKATRKSSKTIALAAGCLLLGFSGGYLGATVQDETRPASLSNEAKAQYISGESELIAGIVKDEGQSVVSIDVSSEVPVQNFFGTDVQTQASAGTGFIVSSSGVIVTNRHVIPAGASNVSVKLADGTTYDNVEVLGRSSSNSSLDVAFLKIKDTKGKKLTVASLGDSSKVKVGDKVIAIGNALGQFANTVTSGIISGFGRDVTAGSSLGQDEESLSDLFQTDAAINAGNSGGPLVNINGQVIGVNTAVAGGAQNIGFAIPINDLKGLISTVLQSGKLIQPFLGVRYISLTDDIASELNLEVRRGAYIAPGSGVSVIAGSPAAKAGLQEKDTITKVNGINIDDKTNLTSALARFRVGDKVTLTINRDGKTLKITVTLEPAPTN